MSGTLKSLELGSNKISKIENLDKLVNMVDLVLAKNKIKKVENLDSMT
jgi:Leucine-rich repeat (LRR) protein